MYPLILLFIIILTNLFISYSWYLALKLNLKQSIVWFLSHDFYEMMCLKNSNLSFLFLYASRTAIVKNEPKWQRHFRCPSLCECFPVKEVYAFAAHGLWLDIWIIEMFIIHTSSDLWGCYLAKDLYSNYRHFSSKSL